MDSIHYPFGCWQCFVHVILAGIAWTKNAADIERVKPLAHAVNVNSSGGCMHKGVTVFCLYTNAKAYVIMKVFALSVNKEL